MSMFEKLCDNLNQLMAETHISADELGRRTNLPSSTIKKIRNRNNPNPTLSTLIPLAEYFSITLSQLVGDEPLPGMRTKGSYKLNPEIIRHIPVLSWQEALLWPATKGQTHSFITTEYEYNDNAYALMVEEEDWENLSKGTALLIDPEIKPEHRDFVIVSKTGQNVPSLKQVLYDEGQMYLKPVVQGYNISIFTQEHRILGIVVEYKKNLRKPLINSTHQINT